MLRFLFIAVPTFALGAIFGAFMWWAFSPLLFDVVVDDQVEIAASDQTIGTGMFKGADRAHQGAGDARLVQKADGSLEIHFTNFTVTNGPDLKVYVSSQSNPEKASDVLDSTWASVSHLKGNKGDQVYRLPAGTMVEDLKSVVIWCEAFSVLFASATFG